MFSRVGFSGKRISSNSLYKNNSMKASNHIPLIQVRESSLSSALRDSRRKSFLTFPESNDADLLYYPQFRLGLDSKLNWQLNIHEITPSEDAYRNLYQKALIQRSLNRDHKKALHIRTSGASQFTVFTAGSETNLENNVLTQQQISELFQNSKKFFENRKEIYVNDAAVGCHASSECWVRVISAEAESSLLLSHILISLPLSETKNLVKFKYELLVYYVPNFKFSIDSEILKNYGITSNGFAHFNVEKNILFAGGNNSTTAFMDLLSSTASQIILKKDPNQVPLNANLARIKNKNVLVFGENFLEKKQGEIVATRNVIWNTRGVVRTWSGNAFPFIPELKKGDLVETRPDKSKVHISKSLQPNLSHHPDSIVFFLSDAQDILPTFSQLSAQQAVQYLLAGYNGNSFNPFFGKRIIGNSDPIVVSENFKKLVETNNVPVYMINTKMSGKELSSENIGKLLSSTVDGSAATAQTQKEFSTLSSISSFPGVTLQKGNPKKEKQILEYLKTTFPYIKILYQK